MKLRIESKLAVLLLLSGCLPACGGDANSPPDDPSSHAGALAAATPPTSLPGLDEDDTFVEPRRRVFVPVPAILDHDGDGIIDILEVFSCSDP